ncbi:MAG: hypothetical protein ACYTFG_12455 [Planctomycetota bacterium]|jgi:hypothetical protein
MTARRRRRKTRSLKKSTSRKAAKASPKGTYHDPLTAVIVFYDASDSPLTPAKRA